MLDDPNNVVVDGTFTLVQMHAADPNCPTWPARYSFYKTASGGNLWTGTPSMVLDGVLHQEGTYTDYQVEYNWIRTQYNSRRATATDVSVSATAVPVSGSTFTVRARVCLDAGGAAKTVRVYVVQVLDHWPPECNYCRNGFVQAASTQDVPLTPGQCTVVTRTMTFPTYSWSHQNDIRIIAWAQTNVSSGIPGSATQIYNARNLSWPFGPDCNANGIPDVQETDCNANHVPDDCDIAGGTPDCNENGIPDSCDIAGGTPDCDGNGIPDSCDLENGAPDCNENDIPDSCDIASGFSQDANSNGVPDECEMLTGDMNCDGTVDFGDINPFVLYITNFSAWQATYLDCPPEVGDINGDGLYPDFGDINPFVALLTG